MNTSDSLYRLFHSAFHLIVRQMMYRTSHHHGGQGQLQILSFLDEQGAMKQKLLAGHLGIREASLSESLVKLEAQGLISRTKDETDRRVLSVAITETGRLFLSERTKHVTKEANDLFSPLTQEEQQQLETLMAKLVESWEAEAALDSEPRIRHSQRRGERHRGHHHE
ncbi:MarR family transcriptional regulator [uncultured Sphaerochaeta sp.]|uniref:MarR family winged helix-turn-helix transcriptional regulator n=1 Tax=uncultured Sphaerochaeta sp. TaxID=886478 RepID=UPI002A0A135F|nr:MarR family transcriptional regulator [uncultured Sphaerochaeta sp.]